MREAMEQETVTSLHGRVEHNGRLIKFYDFDDGGLAAGLRAIHVYLPAMYEESDDHYRVIYFNDGGNTFSGPVGRMDVDLAYDRLIAEGVIHPAIFVGVGNAGLPGRVRDLSPTVDSGYRGHLAGIGGVGGGLEGYYRFLIERLKPFIDTHYRTLSDPGTTGIAGYSLGGSAAFLMAYDHPETFGMAGCMSPSLWWGEEFALDRVRNDTSGKRAVRFYLDGGGSNADYGTWVKAAKAYQLLEQRGWMPGDDLAAYFDYHADHRFESGAGRMREMLYFLLRKEPLALERYRLVYAVDPTAPVMDLRTGHRRIVAPEAWYTGGLRLTVPQPDIHVADTRVVQVDTDNPLLLHGIGPGETMITATFQGHTASLRVIGFDASDLHSNFICPPINASTDRADPIDLSDLPHPICDAEQNVVARFGVGYDTTYIYITAGVWNRSIVVADDKLPWEQDSIGVRFDARPESDLRAGEGYSKPEEFLYIGLSPRPIGEAPCRYPGPDKWELILPAGTETTCVTTPDGYVARLSIPVHYLDEKQGSPWNVFRLNFCVSKFVAVGGPCTDAWWHPGWLDFRSPIGSGIFTRG